MKKSHIFAIAIIGVAIVIIISTAGDSSTYVNFDEAYQLASNGSTSSIHVVGELTKDADGKITGIEKPMPPDFLRSEKVVIIGSYRNDLFVAKKILLKCPSKYQEQKLNAGV
jgi:cytochrome c-type biogenesis protein CcmE